MRSICVESDVGVTVGIGVGAGGDDVVIGGIGDVSLEKVCAFDSRSIRFFEDSVDEDADE